MSETAHYPVDPVDVSQAEADISLAEPGELIIPQMTLYHGSATEGITVLDPAEEYTIGQGVYMTDNPEDAAGYARRSAQIRKASPIVYTAEVHDMRLANLNNPEKLAEVMRGFSKELRTYLDTIPANDWLRRPVLERAISAASVVQPGQVKNVTDSLGDVFARYLSEQGYDGLISREGGETSWVGGHDSYVIFDPAKVAIQSSDKVAI